MCVKYLKLFALAFFIIWLISYRSHCYNIHYYNICCYQHNIITSHDYLFRANHIQADSVPLVNQNPDTPFSVMIADPNCPFLFCPSSRSDDVSSRSNGPNIESTPHATAQHHMHLLLPRSAHGLGVDLLHELSLANSATANESRHGQWKQQFRWTPAAAATAEQQDKD